MISKLFERFRSGEIIFREGDRGTKMYIIRTGEVELAVGGRTVAELGAGGIFGEMVLIDRKPRSATALARTRCELIPMDEQQFLDHIQRNPGFSLDVMKVLAGRLRAMNELMQEASRRIE
jgi:CRP/FNR family transcriptional regulator, cyclic AMP receptor protein